MSSRIDLQMLVGGTIKYKVFKIVKRMVKTNQDIIREKCIRNDDGMYVVNDEDKKIVYKSFHEKLLNTEFAK